MIHSPLNRTAVLIICAFLLVLASIMGPVGTDASTAIKSKAPSIPATLDAAYQHQGPATLFPCLGNGSISVDTVWIKPPYGTTTYQWTFTARPPSVGEAEVLLALPLGYDDGITFPHSTGPSSPYTVTVTTPPYTGSMAVQVDLYTYIRDCTIFNDSADPLVIVPFQIQDSTLKVGTP